jgi:murein DD-endopeptidase MepM/ murein hydrolase activator NlpD
VIRFFPLIAPYKNVGPYGTRGAGFHFGVDLGAPTGTAVIAVDYGTVNFSVDPLGGNVAVLHATDGNAYYMAHMLDVQSGSRKVSAGDAIGRVDMTGNAQGTVPHCHFEWWPSGSYQSPAPDPTAQLVAAPHALSPAPVPSPVTTHTTAIFVALGIVGFSGVLAWALTSGPLRSPGLQRRRAPSRALNRAT